MRVITEKSKTDIGKRLAAIYYITLHGFGEDVGSNFESATKIIEHIYDIAYTIGGELLADIEIPAYVARFNEYMKKKNERKMNDFISCKDCEWGVEYSDTRANVSYWRCENWDGDTEPDGFCHEAKRRKR